MQHNVNLSFLILVFHEIQLEFLFTKLSAIKTEALVVTKY